MTVLFEGFTKTMSDMLLALLPIVIIFLILQVMSLRISRREMKRILLGFVITYIGLVFFMQGVVVAFDPVGAHLGEVIGASPRRWLLIPIGFIMGFLTAYAEPSVRVMIKQVKELSTGAIKAKVMLNVISIGIAIAVSLAMVRLLAGFSLWWYLIPGYIIVLTLSRFVDPVFVGIAFDNGGVATGPMCTTFILSFSVGIASVIEGRNPMLDGFGVVALIALAPILTTLALGCVYKGKRRQEQRLQAEQERQITDTRQTNEDEKTLDTPGK